MLVRRQNIWVQLLLYLPVILHIEMVVPCAYQFDSSMGKTGNFSSPGFPTGYAEDVECYFHFSGEMFETLRITFISFDLEDRYSKGCLTDYVDISTITAYKLKLLVGRFCGSEIPPPIQTMHPSAEIIFKTNHIVQRKGFSGMYEFKDESMVPPPMASTTGIEGCGGVATGMGGVITSPGYPDSFPKDVECLWLVRVHHSQYIYVRILELELHGSIANCADAEIALFDGYFNLAYNPKVLKKYCGDLKYYKNVEEKTEMAPRNRLLVRFRTRVSRRRDRDLATSIVGFKLVWTAVNLVDKGECKSFVCKDSHYCFKSNSAICKETRHYCVDQSMICNGLPNCSDEDFSDEERCHIPLLIGCGTGLGTAMLLVFLGVVYYKRHIRMRKIQSQRQALAVQLRQLEVSPSMLGRLPGRPMMMSFYDPPSLPLSPMSMSPMEMNCSIHSHYDVISNNICYPIPTEV